MLVVLLGLWLAAAAPVLAQPAAEAAKEAGARQSAEEAEALVSAVDSVSNFTKGSSPRPLPLEPQAARLAGPA